MSALPLFFILCCTFCSFISGVPQNILKASAEELSKMVPGGLLGDDFKPESKSDVGKMTQKDFEFMKKWPKWDTMNKESMEKNFADLPTQFQKPDGLKIFNWDKGKADRAWSKATEHLKKLFGSSIASASPVIPKFKSLPEELPTNLGNLIFILLFIPSPPFFS
jgi:hypothetical protein